MRITEANMNAVSVGLYTAGSLAAAAAFFAATLVGDYDWVARLGGSAWVFGLTMVILMPTVPGIVRERVTGEKAAPMVHDHEAMLRGENPEPRPENRVVAKAEHAGHGGGAMMDAREEEVRTMAKDPVCGMDVDTETAAAMSEYLGQRYYFCSVGCQEEFDAEPERFTVEHGDEAEE